MWAPLLTSVVGELTSLRQFAEDQAVDISRLRDENLWLATDLRATKDRLESVEATAIDWRRWLNMSNARVAVTVIMVILCIVTVLNIFAGG
jgi:hypothetical protein